MVEQSHMMKNLRICSRPSESLAIRTASTVQNRTRCLPSQNHDRVTLTAPYGNCKMHNLHHYFLQLGLCVALSATPGIRMLEYLHSRGYALQLTIPQPVSAVYLEGLQEARALQSGARWTRDST